MDRGVPQRSRSERKERHAPIERERASNRCAEREGLLRRVDGRATHIRRGAEAEIERAAGANLPGAPISEWHGVADTAAENEPGAVIAIVVGETERAATIDAGGVTEGHGAAVGRGVVRDADRAADVRGSGTEGKVALANLSRSRGREQRDTDGGTGEHAE